MYGSCLQHLKAEVEHSIVVGQRADVEARAQRLRRSAERAQRRRRRRRRVGVRQVRVQQLRARDADRHVADEAALAQPERAHLQQQREQIQVRRRFCEFIVIYSFTK